MSREKTRLFCPGTSDLNWTGKGLKHTLVAFCMGEDSGHYAGCAIHSYETCVRLEHAYMQIASDCGWRTPALVQCCQVCELRTANQMGFYTLQSLLHTTALPINGLHLEMGLPVDSVHGEICAASLIDLVQINSSTAHKHCLTPQRSMLTKCDGHCLCSNTCTPWYFSREACN